MSTEGNSFSAVISPRSLENDFCFCRYELVRLDILSASDKHAQTAARNASVDIVEEDASPAIAIKVENAVDTQRIGNMNDHMEQRACIAA